MLTFDQARDQVVCLIEREKLEFYVVKYRCGCCNSIIEMHGILYNNRFDTRPCESKGEAINTLATWIQLQSFYQDKREGLE